MEIFVENIKCGGCASSIKKQLMALDQVVEVSVDIASGSIFVTADSVASEDEALRRALCERLLKMGYPEKGSVEGLKAAGAKAKSFVSCAMGKMGQESE